MTVLEKNLRDSKQLQEEGFLVIPFPANLTQLMMSHVTNYVEKMTPAKFVSLTKQIGAFQNEEFRRVFDKSQRQFPDKVGFAALKWVQETMASQLGGKRATINYPWDHRQATTEILSPASTYDIYWRAVRPHQPDVGPAHADSQFWKIFEELYGEICCEIPYDERWKIWFPLYGCDERNSLQLLPGSHIAKVPFLTQKMPDGVVKPDIDSGWLREKESEFICPLDTFENVAILFHDNLIHRGVMNTSSEVRISGEFTILLELEQK